MPDKLLRKTMFHMWKSILALKVFYQQHPDEYHLVSATHSGSHFSFNLQLKRTLHDTVPGLPYCLSFFNVFHNEVSLRNKARSHKISLDVSRGRLTRAYLRELALLDMTVLPRSLAVGFNHVQLANAAQIDQIPGFTEFEKFMLDHPSLLGLSLSASCVALHLSFSNKLALDTPSICSSPLAESPINEVTPTYTDNVPSPAHQILQRILAENPSSLLAHLSLSSALSLISEILHCDMFINMQRLHLDADFAEITQLFSSNAVSQDPDSRSFPT